MENHKQTLNQISEPGIDSGTDLQIQPEFTKVDSPVMCCLGNNSTYPMFTTFNTLNDLHNLYTML